MGTGLVPFYSTQLKQAKECIKGHGKVLYQKPGLKSKVYGVYLVYSNAVYRNVVPNST